MKMSFLDKEEAGFLYYCPGFIQGLEPNQIGMFPFRG